MLFACTKRTKSTPEVCEPLDSGDDSKLCRIRFSIVFRRHVPKPVLPAKRRRKGFESVRKGYRIADARLMFFEKELLYCKLTAASAIQNGLLRVSFGAVGSRCRCALKKVFSLSENFAGTVKAVLFRKPKSFSLAESFTNFTQSRFLRTKTSFARTFLRCPQKIPIFTNQKPFFRTNLSLFPPKAALFHPPPPIPTTLNLLSAKNTTVLLMFA